jgi:hypothetical protein
MRSADIRAGLTRVFTLRQKVVTTSEAPAAISPRTLGYWRLVLAGATILTLLLTAAWYAGRESAGLEAQRVSAQLNKLAQQVASTQLALKQQRAQADQLQKALTASGRNAGLSLQSQLRQQLSQAQAEANQYKTIIEREQRAAAGNSRVLDALTARGTRLIPLKRGEAAAESTAYALLVENSKLVFVASKLPALADRHQLQLWLLRKQEPKLVSAGVFSPDENRAAIMSFEDASVLSDISLLQVTEEPEGGNSAPTGAKLLESANAAEVGRTVSSESKRATEAGLRAGFLHPSQHRDILR